MKMFSMSHAGLVFDIVGAASVAWSFCTAKHDAMVRAVMERTLAEPVDVEGMAAARNDALFGVPVLVAGFLLQLIAALFDDMLQLQLGIAACGLLLVLTCGYALGRRPLIELAVARIRAGTANKEVIMDGGSF